MAKLYTSLLFTSFLLSFNFAISTAEFNDPVHTYSRAGEKYVVFRVYTHGAMGGPNATIWEVARAVITYCSPTQFGQVRVVDDKITLTPDRNSTVLGRAQGIVVSADMKVSGIAMYVNVVFTSGAFNGSTLSLLGRNPDSPVREIAIVGGTGVFRRAQGYTIFTTYSFDPVENYAIMEHTMHVYYYGSGLSDV